MNQHAGFAVTGVTDPAEMIQAVVAQTRQAVDPAPEINPYTIEIDGKSVVVAEVVPLLPNLKPATYQGRAYLRQADGDYVMNANDLHMVQVAGLHHSQHHRYDLIPVEGTGIGDLDDTLVQQYLTRVRATSSRLRSVEDDADLLRLTGIIDHDGVATVAGLYGLGFYPQGRLPALGVTAAVRLPRDGSGVRTQNLEHFDGPLPALLESVVEWVSRNISMSQVYRPDGNMEKRPEFPLNAVREIVANALVHRDLGPDSLGVGKKVEIRLSPEALVVVNPGGLRGVSVDQLTSAELSKAAVNQRLYEASKFLTTQDGASVIEGEGIRETLASMRDADLHRPRFIDTGVQFKVILRRGPVFTPEDRAHLNALAQGEVLTHMQKVLVLGLARDEEWTITRMCSEFSPLTRSEALAQVDGLTARGLVKVESDHLTWTGRRRTDNPTPNPDERGRENQTQLRGLPGSSQRSTRVTKNGPVILDALRHAGNQTVGELVSRTALTDGQVRYALAVLVDAGSVVMHGQQGSHATTYSVPD
ncbi:ATP-binding protein [Corynebacterium efficiens]|uniref:ATP-binding protein n=1 Tax=Corynebacterium efficiens TaxID=152794 RepID=UPI00138A3D90|nr:ATP-binding protein [Corynebacterium efficiens]